ncbi:MAG: hypothetical protein ACM4D3_05430 [Candidatus Sericytochromatia bacterium]
MAPAVGSLVDVVPEGVLSAVAGADGENEIGFRVCDVGELVGEAIPGVLRRPWRSRSARWQRADCGRHR